MIFPFINFFNSFFLYVGNSIDDILNKEIAKSELKKGSKNLYSHSDEILGFVASVDLSVYTLKTDLDEKPHEFFKGLVTQKLLEFSEKNISPFSYVTDPDHQEDLIFKLNLQLKEREKTIYQVKFEFKKKK